MSNLKEKFLEDSKEHFKAEAKVSDKLNKNVNRLLGNIKNLETLFTKVK